ncbi:MAG: hypothetical protein NVS2B3_16150 [Vulcanimicrobiaceae bacterium]
MSVSTSFWLALGALGIALSARSLFVLRGGSAATSLGWLATIAYLVVAALDAWHRGRVAGHLDWWLLAVLTVAFVVAGVRDEPQAEPWWWPQRRGLTGAQRRAKRS